MIGRFWGMDGSWETAGCVRYAKGMPVFPDSRGARPPLPRHQPPLELGAITHEGVPLRIAAATFPNGRVALFLTKYLATERRWSINVPSFELARNETLVKTYDENAPLRPVMLATGLFEDTGERVAVGFVTLELWRLTPTVMERLEPLLAASSG